MDLVQSILLHTMWVVHLFFQRLLSNRSDNLPKSRKQPTTNSLTPRKIPTIKILPNVMKDIIEFESNAHRRTSRMRKSQTISHFLFDEKKSGLVDMSDVVSPVEEEMLRWLCAKGVETKRNQRHSGRLTKSCSEMCIPRDIFTNVWLNSYLTHSSPA
ncbi:uncharacterized protein [Atheta coriaria]|uniref:uncharacterized protein n=1 Tax=Dalotia coriaria TaxID=877792 RepID=UPI0031F438C0